MRSFVSMLLSAFFGSTKGLSGSASARSGAEAVDRAFPTKAPFRYRGLIHLDAEALSHGGIVAAYQRLLPALLAFVPHPDEMTDEVDLKSGCYRIRCSGHDYLIHSPFQPETMKTRWPRAVYFFFLAVNHQLIGTNVQLYAINGGNALGAVFMTPEQAAQARDALPRKRDWPYIPELDHPWNGRSH